MSPNWAICFCTVARRSSSSDRDSGIYNLLTERITTLGYVPQKKETPNRHFYVGHPRRGSGLFPSHWTG